MEAASKIKKNGTMGTTICNLGGIGIGYEMNGEVYVNGNNGFFYKKRNLKSFIPDNGKGYMNAVYKMTGK